MKELFLPGLRDYVKSFYPLGPVWSPAGKVIPATSMKVTARSAPAPPPPSAPLFSTETSQASARPKEGMAAVFQEISSGKSVTEGTIGSVYKFIFFCKGSIDLYPVRYAALCFSYFCCFKGLRKVTDDMKTKNRAERTGVVNANEIVHKNLPSLSKSVVAPNPKFELQMGRKYVC